MFFKLFPAAVLAIFALAQGAVAQTDCGPGFGNCPSGLICSPPSETGCFTPPTIPIKVDVGHCLPPCST
ncbi:hypothetical protein B0H19DRAFT_1371392 [Mycena capillaripes]|nr:hypothetical protein B0H19DRAFT_1371392 [Mycena capillaripes]